MDSMAGMCRPLKRGGKGVVEPVVVVVMVVRKMQACTGQVGVRHDEDVHDVRRESA